MVIWSLLSCTTGSGVAVFFVDVLTRLAEISGVYMKLASRIRWKSSVVQISTAIMRTRVTVLALIEWDKR